MIFRLPARSRRAGTQSSRSIPVVTNRSAFAENRHEAGLGLNEVGVLVSLRDRGDRALVADDLSRNGAIGREAGDDLGRRGGLIAGQRGSARGE